MTDEGRPVIALEAPEASVRRLPRQCRLENSSIRVNERLSGSAGPCLGYCRGPIRHDPDRLRGLRFGWAFMTGCL